jgi:histidyl-tRNA synthetase
VDPALARGADYYTGPVYEAVSDVPGVGSIAGGGRYDGLVGALSGREVPAVGVSLGLERILVVMDELGMVQARPTAAQVLVTWFDPSCTAAAARAAAALRAGGIDAELYVGDGSFKAQFKHADKRGYPWIAIVGPDERDGGTVTLKDAIRRENVTLALDRAADYIGRPSGA